MIYINQALNDNRLMKAIIGLSASEFNEFIYRFDKELQNKIKIQYTNGNRKSKIFYNTYSSGICVC